MSLRKARVPDRFHLPICSPMMTLAQSSDGLMRPVSAALTSRRQWLQIGAVALAGFNPIRVIRAGAAEPLPPVRSCIFIFYQGGPSHLDTWDMKPKAPTEVRGEFR